MKRIAAVVLLLAAAVGGYGWYSLSRSGPTIRIATEAAFPPFNFIGEDGKPQGFDVDIAHALCQAMRAKCEIIVRGWDGMIPGLLAEQYDAIVSSMSITEQRSEQVSFTDKYYRYSAPERFVARKGAKIAVSPTGLAGRTVGVQRATVYETFLRANFPGAIPVLYESQAAANHEMATGKLDLLFSDSLVLSIGFLRTPDGEKFEFVGPAYGDLTALDSGAGIALRQSDVELRQEFNRAIKAIRADGTYRKLNEKYFDFDIYGD